MSPLGKAMLAAKRRRSLMPYDRDVPRFLALTDQINKLARTAALTWR